MNKHNITADMEKGLEAVKNIYKAALMDRDEALLKFSPIDASETAKIKETLEVSYLGGESINVEV